MHLHVPCIEKCAGVLVKERKILFNFQTFGVDKRGIKERRRRRGNMMKRLTCTREGEKRRKKKTNFDFISKHWFQFRSTFYSNYVSEQLSCAGHKLGFAVAACLNRRAYSLRPLTWLCGSTLFPILKRNKFCHFQPCHYPGIFY